MYIEKLFLRTEDGAVRASLTVKKEAGIVRIILPKGTAFIAATDRGGRRLDAKGSQGELLFSETPDALLAEKEGVRLYAFYGEGDFSFRKWALLSSLSEALSAQEEEITPTYTEISEETSETETPAEEPSEEISTPSDEESARDSGSDDKRRKLQEIFERGEPFLGFEKLIEGSKWVRMPEEDYLIGIVGDIVLYGVPGRLGETPDENCDWTFLPVSEDNEDWGYYICKSRDTE